MFKKSLFIFSIFCSYLGSVWAFDLSQITAQLNQTPTLSGNFEQLKYLKGFPKPLKTLGTFTFWADHGIVWETHKPFASKIVLTPSRLESINNYQHQTFSTENNPHLALINHLLIDLMQGDIKEIEKYFDITLSGKANNWTMSLVPIDQNIKVVFEKIVIRGAKEVRQLLFYAPNGDKTEIALSDQHKPKSMPKDLQS